MLFRNSRKYIIVFVVIVFIVSFFAFQVTRPDKLFKTIDSWKILESSFDASLLWQMQGLPAQRDIDLGVGNESLIVSNGTILYWQPTDFSNALTSPLLIGLDTHTGENLWQIPTDDAISQIYSLEREFLITSPIEMKLVSSSGQIIWTIGVNSILPLRDVIGVTLEDNILNILTTSNVYYLNAQGGEIIGQDDIQKALLFSGNKALVIDSDTTVSLISMDNNSAEYTIEFPSMYFQDTKLNSIYPRVERFEDILLFYFETRGIEAYDFISGDLLWTLQQPMYSTPALVGEVIAVYNADNEIEFVNPLDGQKVGYIRLASTNELEECENLYSRRISGEEGILVIRCFGNSDLLAIDISRLSF